MNLQPRLPRLGRMLLLIVALCMAPTLRVVGQQARPTFVAGEILLYMQPGTPQADVQAVAGLVHADATIPLLLADCYKIVLPADKRKEADTLDAVATLKQDARVRWVGPNRLFRLLQVPTSEPNDPRYKSGEQWNLKMINMPQAWALQKGAPNTNVAIIDSGGDPQHEDLIGQYDPGSFDFADNDPDITADGTGPEAQHGVFTGGIICALTDNNKGIAGICWQNIKLVMCKAQKKGTDAPDSAAIVNALTYLAANKDKYHIVALNMSFGGGGNPADTTDPLYVATKAVADAGIVPVASAGNDAANNASQVPSGYPFVISVSAVGPSGRLATYSSFGKVELAAPGGDIDASGVSTDGILSTENGTYQFEQGTSAAAPHVAAVAGLMRSVPGVTAQDTISALESEARRQGLGLSTLPDAKYGFGILDAYASLLRVSVRVAVLDPPGVNAQGQSSELNGTPQPQQTLRPTFRFQLANIASFQVKIDGQVVESGTMDNGNLSLSGLPDVQAGLEPGSSPPRLFTVRLRHSLDAGQHTIVITGTNPGGNRSVDDTRTITIQPFVLPTGRSFFSIPYYESAGDVNRPTNQDALLGIRGSDPTSSNIALYRWVPSLNRYVAYPSSDANKNLVTFDLPADLAPRTDQDSTPRPPLGLAWFVDNRDTPKPILTYGQDFPDQGFRIPLQKGWNMVGDPYHFSVPFNSALIELPTGSRITIQEAVNQNLVLPNIYRFVEGQYVFQTLPDGTFNPWEGHWIFINPGGPHDQMNLILSPTPVNNLAQTVSSGSNATSRQERGGQTTRAAVTTNPDGTPRVSGTGSWALRLVARTHNLIDSHNFVGMTTRATDGNDRTKVPKPPMIAPYISLGVLRPDLQAGIYAQDLRPIGGVKTWDLAVSTDQARSDVELTWPNIQTLPRNYRLTLTDKVTGQTVDLRRQSSYRFTTGAKAETRAFTLTARPTTVGGRPVFSGIFINPNISRAGGPPTYEIGYTVSQDVRVEVSILAANGRVLAHVGSTRDVTSGENRVIWNGRDAAGNAVPAGVYSLQLRAITSDGEVTREIRPFLNPGR